MNAPAARLLLRASRLGDYFAKRHSFKVVSRPGEERLKNPAPANAPDVPAQIARRIELSGPTTVADYMQNALTHSPGSYYMSRDVFGRGGDFVTSPEINQVFGEVLGAWLVGEWRRLGAPTPFRLVEFGPGRGTLLADLLKVFLAVGIEPKDFSIHLIEVSPALLRLQAERLCSYHKEVDSQPHYYEGDSIHDNKVYWYKSLESVPKGFNFFIAHEFFDALPIHKFKKTDKGWREVLIDLQSKSEKDLKNPKFRYVLSKEETTASKLYSKLAEKDAEDFEIAPSGLLTVKNLATRIDEDGGIGIIVDYGKNGATGDTFRAFKNHKQVDPLVDVGNSDLTADVNFALLKEAGSQARVFGPVSQRSFLQTLRADLRLEALAKKATPEQMENFKSSYNMLVDPEKMGERFKFMAMFPTITDEHYEKYPVLGFS